ncbi:MAG: hypothetical protein ACT4NU_06375 [Chromatiales bacterium]
MTGRPLVELGRIDAEQPDARLALAAEYRVAVNDCAYRTDRAQVRGVLDCAG